MSDADGMDPSIHLGTAVLIPRKKEMKGENIKT
jgi:hypothetical protein